MSSTVTKGRIQSTLCQFLDNEASGGINLMVVAIMAILTANSGLAGSYFSLLHLYIGPLSLQHRINDALMAVFFLLVGLEIRCEMLDGQSRLRGRAYPVLTESAERGPAIFER